MKYGLWTPLGDRSAVRVLCRCECGTEREVLRRDLEAGKSQGCGCAGRVRMAAQGKANRRHGLANTPTHQSWSDMKRRCTAKHRPDYARYGGAGVKVCDRWLSFDHFLADMGERPEGKTLDRIRTSGDYEPGNCRWADRPTQERNKTNNRIVTYGGSEMTLTEAAEKAGVNYYTAHGRLRRGWSVDRALGG